MKQKKGASQRPTRKKAVIRRIDLSIDTLDTDGVGKGRFEGKEVMVAGALPGEKVVAIVEHEGQRRIIARLSKVLERSPDRRRAPCPMAHKCMGCSLIHMRDKCQLQFKQNKVQSALAAFPEVSKAEMHPIWNAPSPLGYRTNAKLAIGKHRGQVQIGLFRRGTHEIVDLSGCPLHHPLINKVVDVVRDEIQRQGIYVYNPKTQRGLLRYLTVKISPGSNKAMVTFITAERNFREITHLGKWLRKKVPEVISVHQNVNASEGNVIFGRETLKMLGVHDLIDQVGETRLRISPTSFFQVNNEQAARIYSLVRSWAALKPNETAVDMYCGIGGIALNLAKDAGQVIGIEVIEEAVANARTNAQMNELSNCTFRAGDAADLVADLAVEVPPGSVVTVNPPRSGCDFEVLSALTKLAPRTLIYVSCNPETLARDLNILHAKGYLAMEVQPVDMFPQTGHVETVVRLEPAAK